MAACERDRGFSYAAFEMSNCFFGHPATFCTLSRLASHGTYASFCVLECSLIHIPQAAFRADNRLSREIRPISFAFDTTPAADGSATCEMGLTVVQVAVYGPREPRRAGQGGAGGGGHAGPVTDGEARVEVDCSVAGFVAGERRKRTKGDK